MSYQLLDWDSKNFGFKVSKIIGGEHDQKMLEAILRENQKQQVKLSYYFAVEKLAPEVIDKLGGSLVDEKVTYIIDLTNQKLLNTKDESVESYIQSGLYSRFSVDSKFPQDKFEAMYRQWIYGSMQKTIAKELLVIREDTSVVGIITLGDKSGRGDIGLVAVDSTCRGKQYGTRLVKSAINWFAKNQYTLVQVVTQGVNKPACNLYEKCGFSREKVEYVYHFWL